MKDVTERGGEGAGGGSSAGGGGGRSRAGAGAGAGGEASSSASGGAATTTASAAPTRSSGITRRRQTFKKVGGNVAEDIFDELQDYLRFVKGIEGEEPDMDTVMENALDALFRRARGFKQWRKDEGADAEVEDALASLVGGQPQGGASSTGAQSSAS